MKLYPNTVTDLFKFFSNFRRPEGTVPAVTAIKFRDALTLGVGTSTGHVST